MGAAIGQFMAAAEPLAATSEMLFVIVRRHAATSFLLGLSIRIEHHSQFDRIEPCLC